MALKHEFRVIFTFCDLNNLAKAEILIDNSLWELAKATFIFKSIQFIINLKNPSY